MQKGQAYEPIKLLIAAAVGLIVLVLLMNIIFSSSPPSDAPDLVIGRMISELKTTFGVARVSESKISFNEGDLLTGYGLQVSFSGEKKVKFCTYGEHAERGNPNKYKNPPYALVEFPEGDEAACDLDFYFNISTGASFEGSSPSNITVQKATKGFVRVYHGKDSFYVGFKESR